MSHISIAIDGPASAGKSTMARVIAHKLSYIYADTGALYRAIGLYAESNGIKTTDREAVASILNDITVELRFIDGEQRVFLNNRDVSEEIRLPEMSMHASNVSAIPEVREFLLEQQRSMARNNNVIMDGRDIGTIVLPKADVKIFLTASPEIRAKRRFDEYAARGQNVDYDELLAEVKQRDYNDSHREIAQLKQAEDAVLVDTSNENLDEAIAHVLQVIYNKLGIN